MKISLKTIGHTRRYGLSLIEVLVALTMTLIVLVAMMQAFKFASNEMAKGRASVELTNQLRTVEDLLRSDLRSLTVDAKPHYNLSAAPKGYFEIVDGPAVDVNYIPDLFGVAATTANVNRSILNLAMGDYDDIVAGTIRSSSVPFRGRNGNAVEESSLAEVIWFTVPNDPDGDFFVDATERASLYRRLLLVKPSLGKILPAGTATYPNLAAANTALNTYLEFNDISASVQPGPPSGTGPTFIIEANSLESLTFRANRFFAATQGQVAAGVYRNQLLLRRSTDQQDFIMSDVTAFDVRVFDPAENVFVTTVAPLVINDIEPFQSTSDFALNAISAALGGTVFTTDESATPLNVGGAYVDLGKGTGIGPLGRKPFGYGFTAARFGIPTRTNFTDVYYDTGTPAYESNNIDDDIATDTAGLIDEGRDGIDNDGDGLIDELPFAIDANTNGVLEFAEVNLGESEVPAPYTVAIRGLKVLIRGTEPLTKQVSQVTVTESLSAE